MPLVLASPKIVVVQRRAANLKEILIKRTISLFERQSSQEREFSRMSSTVRLRVLAPGQSRTAKLTPAQVVETWNIAKLKIS